MHRMIGVLAVLGSLAALPACAHSLPGGFQMDVVVDGRPVPVYYGHGTRYVEAIKGREYSIRLRNPLGVRVAVALSVDGLNTIDARRSDPRSAQKWVLGPYETITISGWQTNMSQARRFYFTSEEQSYAQWLGNTNNVGIISAVYFRERVPPPPPRPLVTPGARGAGEAPSSGPSRDQSRTRQESQPQASHAERESAAKMEADEYAATGIGDRMDHRVQRIRMELEDHPVVTLNVRYEYRPQLVRLGIFPPSPAPYPDPLARRQNARGFEPGFCPVPR